jgi:outer membrane protein
MPSPSTSAHVRGCRRPVLVWTAARLALTALFAMALCAPFCVTTARGQTARDTTGAAFDHFGSDSLPLPVAVGERWSLARCVAAALQQNGDVRVARARTRQASGSALSAWGGILPSLDVGASRSRFWPDKANSTQLVPVQQGDSTVLVEVSLNRRDATTLDATVQTNLLSVPSWSEKRRRDRLHEGARWNEAETRNTVVFQVKQQYFNLLKAERLASVARETELLARDEEARSEALFEVGTVARGDVLKARARRAQTQLDRIRAYNQVKIQTERLKQVIGLPAGSAISVEPILEQPVAIPDSSASIRAALAGRPSLESALAAERAARSGVTGAWGARFPLLTASYFVSHAKTSNAFEVGGVSEREELTGTDRQGELRVSLPIFDGLAIEGNIRQAKGVLAEAEANRRQLELDVAVEVQQAWLALREADERIGVAREGLASAEEDYNFSKSRYELGAGTFLDLLNAEVSLAQARQSHVEALADARVAEADLERAIGERRY